MIITISKTVRRWNLQVHFEGNELNFKLLKIETLHNVTKF